MIGQSLIAREAKILDTLQAAHQAREKFTLIGGYAVNAYSTLPRYSIDCDLVIAKRDFNHLSSFLKEQGYQKPARIYDNELEGIQTWKFIARVKGTDTVAVELLVDGIRCRQTGAVWRQEEVRESSKELRVAGVNRSIVSNPASRELLIAMKLHSGRPPDQRDVVMLSAEADWNQVVKLIDRGSRAKLIHQLKSSVGAMGGAEFGSQLKAAFLSKQNQDGRIRSVINEVDQLLMAVEKTKDR